MTIRYTLFPILFTAVLFSGVPLPAGVQHALGEPSEAAGTPPYEAPGFNGGDLTNFRYWVADQLIYPLPLLKEKITGKVVVSFVINQEGRLVDPKIEESDHELFSREVMRVLQRSPKWTPGTDKNGRPIQVSFHFPVLFQL